MGKRPDSAAPERSIIIACNCPPDVLENVIRLTVLQEGVDAYMIGDEIGVAGLSAAVKYIRGLDPSKKVIFDPRIKPDPSGRTREVPPAEQYVKKVRDAGIYAVLTFLTGDMQYQKETIDAVKAADLVPIVSPEPEEKFNISDKKLFTALNLAKGKGVTSFWLRAEPWERVMLYNRALRCLFRGEKNYEVFIAKSFNKYGKLKSAAPLAAFGHVKQHFVIGEAVYGSDDSSKITQEIAREFINGSS